jgi:endonuclease G
VGSHNIRTPEFIWKVIIQGDGQTIAWYIPNDTKALSANLDKYLVTPAQVQTRAKVKLPEVPKVWLRKKPKTSWPLPDGCQPG